MSTELFDQPDQCNPTMPYDPVVNRLSFFSVSLFDHEFHSLNTDPPLPSHGSSDSDQGLKVLKLGLPISDLFPETLPEAPTVVIERNGQKFRVSSNGMMLPAKTNNRRFSEGVQIELKGNSKGVIVPDAYKNLIKTFSPKENEALSKGLMITKMAGKKIMRFSLDPSLRKYMTSPQTGTQTTNNVKEYPPDAPSTLNDDEFFEVMALLVDRIPSSRFISGAWGNDRRNELLEIYRKDPRASRYHSKDDYLTLARDGVSPSEFPTYEIGLLSRYEQEWLLTGYSRGSLTSAFTLAPNEEMLLEVFTWDRAKLEELHESNVDYERNVETSNISKLSAKISNEIREKTNQQGGLGVALEVQQIPLNLIGDFSADKAVTEKMKGSVNFISDTTNRASERYKVTNQVKVVQARETGREERVTRRIKNPNLGRTLTMNCFEVMEHYDVTTSMKSTEPELVLLVNFPRPREFDPLFVLAYQDKLQRALLSSTYIGGFEAAKKKLAQEFFDNRSLIKVEIDAAQAKERLEQEAEGQPVPAIVAVAKSIRKIIRQLKDLDLVEEIRTLAESYAGAKISEAERSRANAALGRFNFWLKFKMVTPGIEPKAIEFAKIPGSPTEKEAYEALSAFVTGLDDEWVTAAKMIAANLVSVQLGFTLIVVFPWLTPVLLEFALIEDNMGLPGLIEKAKKEIRRYDVESKVPQATKGSGDGKNALPPPLAPPQLYTLAELAEADAEFRKLQAHLEANAVYYMNFIMAQEDPNIRYEKLKALGVHRVVENRLLGFIGRKAIFPLKIENLEPETRTFITTKLLSNWLDGKGKLQLPSIAPTNIKVALPTGGLYMEAIVGQCDALEPFLKESRDLELAVARAQALLAEERAKQMVIETQRRQKKIDNGELDPAT